jgi:uncharacterized protein Yka (UPF0111/DUF47 family)
VLLDRIVRWLLPRENRFFLYLNSIGKNVARGADVFAELLTAKGPDEFRAVAERLRTVEHEGDEMSHLLYDEIDKTFVTPIDREDLHALTSRLDDVLDSLEAGAGRIVVYRLQALTEPMKGLIRIAHECSHEVARAVTLLEDASRTNEINVIAVRVNSLENEGDNIYRQELERIFASRPDPIELIREKEILDVLEEAIDECEDVIDLVRSVIVKNG